MVFAFSGAFSGWTEAVSDVVERSSSSVPRTTWTVNLPRTQVESSEGAAEVSPAKDHESSALNVFKDSLVNPAATCPALSETGFPIPLSDGALSEGTGGGVGAPATDGADAFPGITLVDRSKATDVCGVKF